MANFNRTWSSASITGDTLRFDKRQSTPKRTIGIQCKPSVFDRNIFTDRILMRDVAITANSASTNQKATNTENEQKVTSATNTDNKVSYSVACETDVSIFHGLKVVEDKAINTDDIYKQDKCINTDKDEKFNMLMVDQCLSTLGLYNTRNQAINTDIKKTKSIGSSTNSFNELTPCNTLSRSRTSKSGAYSLDFNPYDSLSRSSTLKSRNSSYSFDVGNSDSILDATTISNENMTDKCNPFQTDTEEKLCFEFQNRLNEYQNDSGIYENDNNPFFNSTNNERIYEEIKTPRKYLSLDRKASTNHSNSEENHYEDEVMLKQGSHMEKLIATKLAQNHIKEMGGFSEVSIKNQVIRNEHENKSHLEISKSQNKLVEMITTNEIVNGKMMKVIKRIETTYLDSPVEHSNSDIPPANSMSSLTVYSVLPKRNDDVKLSTNESMANLNNKPQNYAYSHGSLKKSSSRQISEQAAIKNNGSVNAATTHTNVDDLFSHMYGSVKKSPSRNSKEKSPSPSSKSSSKSSTISKGYEHYFKMNGNKRK